MRTRITADWVVGHEAGQHCLIEQGEVVYQDARIIFVGHTFPGEVDVTHDYGKALIAPGFIDLDAAQWFTDRVRNRRAEDVPVDSSLENVESKRSLSDVKERVEASELQSVGRKPRRGNPAFAAVIFG